mmetsp:Transcript_37874/g.109168  ORF Transcript_37874/g.109168 Transcript_37874/m.109168 type:complete len:264 (-) Transcript_37874:12-803(-)
MVVAARKRSQGLLQLPQVPEAQRGVFARGQHLVRHVRVVVHVSRAEEVRTVPLEGELAAAEVPGLQVGVVHGADLLRVVRVEARAVASLPHLQRGHPPQVRAGRGALEDVEGLRVSHDHVLLIVGVPQCALHCSERRLIIGQTADLLQRRLLAVRVARAPQPQRRGALPTSVGQNLPAVLRRDAEQPDLVVVGQGLSADDLGSVVGELQEVELVPLLQGAGADHEAVAAGLAPRHRRHTSGRLPAEVHADARLRHDAPPLPPT